MSVVHRLVAWDGHLAWNPSSDNVGVSGYDILRAPGASGGTFTQVATATGTSHTNTGLAANTTYRYQVCARDAAGNTSPVSNTGTSTITGWTVTFTLPAGHLITGSWNANVTISGQAVTARGVSHNSTLAPGAAGEWGFQASRPNGNTALPGAATCTSP